MGWDRTSWPRCHIYKKKFRHTAKCSSLTGHRTIICIRMAGTGNCFEGQWWAWSLYPGSSRCETCPFQCEHSWACAVQGEFPSAEVMTCTCAVAPCHAHAQSRFPASDQAEDLRDGPRRSFSPGKLVHVPKVCVVETTRSSAQGNCSAKSLAPVMSILPCSSNLPCPPCLPLVMLSAGGSSCGGGGLGLGMGEGVVGGWRGG